MSRRTEVVSLLSVLDRRTGRRGVKSTRLEHTQRETCSPVSYRDDVSSDLRSPRSQNGDKGVGVESSNSLPKPEPVTPPEVETDPCQNHRV